MKLSAILAAASLAAGCATSAPSVPVHRDATEALIRHPQFTDAAKAAPQFVTEALHVITRYEAELALRK